MNKRTIKGILIILGAVIVLFLVVPKISNLIKHVGDKKRLPDEVVNMDEVKAQWADTPSEIDGWSMLDKVNAGLQPIKNFDSDGDGLTDKEEVEIYGSDPAKTSTADDLYTDGYKVEHGMSLNAHYDRENIEFKGNACEEVILTAKTVNDLNAHVEDADNSRIEGYTVYKTYKIYNYNGTLDIDTSDIINTEGIKAADITVLIAHWYGGEMWSSKAVVNGSVITPDYEFDGSNGYVVVLARKDSVFSPSKPEYKDGALNSGSGASNFLYVHIFSFRNLFFNAKPHLYYVPTGNKNADQFTKNYLLAISYHIVDGYGLDGLSDADIKEVSETKLKALKAVVERFPAFAFNSVNDELGPKHFFLVYNDKIVLNPEDYKASVTGIKTIKNDPHSNTGFDITKDAFPFENFGSEYANVGNCAGIAAFTAQVFNEKSAPSSGSYASNSYTNGVNTVSWDISNDETNDTLTDSELWDYKGHLFVSDHADKSGCLQGLTNGEQEFVKMIGAYWAEENDVVRSAGATYYISDKIGTFSWDTIKIMMDRLDSGEILSLSLIGTGLGAHKVNVVNYKQIDDGNTVIFYIYDCNYPLNQDNSSFIDNTLTVWKTEYPEGYQESFKYCYKPINDDEYNSEVNSEGIKRFVVTDHHHNILNAELQN
ncbi:MAG: thrombospondin type 3 repeat-containing protein [Butyrivibrio sp.]|nr:thrombospondin type 3 repeat-containing protein [Butyrivibrio sp.]